MPPLRDELGKLNAVYRPAPAFLQRAVFLTILSFVFFLGTMFIYYVRQGFVYFILASAFLVLYVISLISFFGQRKNVLKVYEHGIEFKNNKALWTDIESVSDEGVVQITGDRKMVIPKSLGNFDDIVRHVRSMVQR